MADFPGFHLFKFWSVSATPVTRNNSKINYIEKCEFWNNVILIFTVAVIIAFCDVTPLVMASCPNATWQPYNSTMTFQAPFIVLPSWPQYRTVCRAPRTLANSTKVYVPGYLFVQDPGQGCKTAAPLLGSAVLNVNISDVSQGYIMECCFEDTSSDSMTNYLIFND